MKAVVPKYFYFNKMELLTFSYWNFFEFTSYFLLPIIFRINSDECLLMLNVFRYQMMVITMMTDQLKVKTCNYMIRSRSLTSFAIPTTKVKLQKQARKQTKGNKAQIFSNLLQFSQRFTCQSISTWILTWILLASAAPCRAKLTKSSAELTSVL